MDKATVQHTMKPKRILFFFCELWKVMEGLVVPVTALWLQCSMWHGAEMLFFLKINSINFYALQSWTIIRNWYQRLHYHSVEGRTLRVLLIHAHIQRHTQSKEVELVWLTVTRVEDEANVFRATKTLPKPEMNKRWQQRENQAKNMYVF